MLSPARLRGRARRVTPLFGRRVPGRRYVLRPSAYVILRDARDYVAVVENPAGIYLLGGGLEPGEGPEEAAIREAREECGFVVRIVERIAVADQFAHSVPARRYVMKRSTFFRAEQLGAVAKLETNHLLRWVSLPEATRVLSPESHRWAVAEERRLAAAHGDRRDSGR